MRIINVISRTDAYILIRDLNLKPKAAGTIDVDTLILSELKSLRNLSMANDIIISESDLNYIANKIASVSGGNVVKSVNEEIGDVVLDAADVGAPTSTYVNEQLDTKANSIAVTQALSTKADLVGGVIPANQLPSFVDDVLEYANLGSFPVVGEASKIYIAFDTNKTYRWGGSSYVEIGGGVALGETAQTAYRGDRGKIAYDHSLSQGNPHNTTTSEIAEGTNKYFTESRVNQTVLTGLNTNTATPALATDNLLAAIGKLQAQISNSSSGSSGFNWVNADQISGLTLDSPVQHKSLKFAKKDGILWVCGSLHAQGATNASIKFFNISNSAYMVEQHVTNFFGVASQVAVCNINAHPITIGSPPSNVNALAMFYVLNTNLYLRTSYGFSADGGFIAFNPTPIGRLLN